MFRAVKCENNGEWDEYILGEGGHPLQLSGWGELKAAHNWRVHRVFVYGNDNIVGAAQLLVRALPWPLKALVYVPRGPVVIGDNRAGVLQVISEYAKQQFDAVVITVEPDWTEATGLESWRKSPNTILIPRTLILDLNKSEDELLAAMTKKTRQYIRKSGTEAIEVRRVGNREELAACLAVYRQTAERANFSIHDDDYYYDVFDKLGDHSPVTAAFLDGQPIAFLWLAISSTTAFELYGGMNDDGQRLRANYALKWYTIQLMKKWGIERYDMNGLLHDGISTFKQGFADHEDLLVGTYDKPLSPLYIVWHKGLPVFKKLVRKFRKR